MLSTQLLAKISRFARKASIFLITPTNHLFQFNVVQMYAWFKHSSQKKPKGVCPNHWFKKCHIEKIHYLYYFENIALHYYIRKRSALFCEWIVRILIIELQVDVQLKIWFKPCIANMLQNCTHAIVRCNASSQAGMLHKHCPHHDFLSLRRTWQDIFTFWLDRACTSNAHTCT